MAVKMAIKCYTQAKNKKLGTVNFVPMNVKKYIQNKYAVEQQ